MTATGARNASAMRFDDRYRTVPEARIVDMLVLAGWAYAPRGDAPSTQAREALGGWTEFGLVYRTTGAGTRLYDPAEVWWIMKRCGRGGHDPYFQDRHVTTGRQLVTDLSCSPAAAGRFAIEFGRTFETAHLPAGASLRLRLPLPLEQVHADRSVELLGDAIDRGSVTCHGNRLELRCRPSDQPLTLAARIGFGAPRATGMAEDRERYLRTRDGPVVASARVHALAHRLAGRGCTVAQAVRAFWIFLIEGFVCAPVHYDQIDPAAAGDWVLDTGCYDCRLGAALFVALCRARDIPARLIGGHLLYKRAPTNHFWAEYWHAEDGWTPVDFLGWDLSGGGGDPVWRDRFFGQIDARLVTEILPLAFVGAPGVPIPTQWHLLQTGAADGAIELALTALDGRPIYTDAVRLL